MSQTELEEKVTQLSKDFPQIDVNTHRKYVEMCIDWDFDPIAIDGLYKEMGRDLTTELAEKMLAEDEGVKAYSGLFSQIRT